MGSSDGEDDYDNFHSALDDSIRNVRGQPC